MRFSPPLTRATLIRRYKRFLADVSLAGRSVTVHCPNTGAMLGCDAPGSTVWLSHSANPARRYPWTWEQVRTAQGTRVGIHTGRSNALVREALEAGLIPALAGYRRIRPEVRYGSGAGRADFVLEGHRRRADCVLEVKNVTALAERAVAMFPDAVSARATRHLHALCREAGAGRRAVLLYCVQRDDVQRVRPADEIDSAYAGALRQALAAGVEVLAYAARVSPREVVLYRKLAVAG